MILKRDPEDCVRICAEQLTNGEHVTCSCAYSVPTNLSPAAKEVVVFPAEWALLDEIIDLSCQIENSERANRLFFGQFEKKPGNNTKFISPRQHYLWIATAQRRGLMS